MKVYYAHPISMYGSKQEKMDIKTLEDMGFEVLNPSELQHQTSEDMKHYLNLAITCDVIAFRAFEDSKIGAGVVLEIDECRKYGILIIELPTFHSDRYLDRKETHNRVRGESNVD